MKCRFSYIVIVILLLISCQKEEEKPVVDTLMPAQSATIYGKVTCNGVPVSGVVVSDGVVCGRTDGKGVYNLKSAKHNGLVFISVPSGYVTPYNGSTVPSFWKSLKKLKDEPDRVDFTLEAENQDRYTMLFMGDIHLYSHKSINCFNSTFIPEINSYISSSASCPVYASTLGDMTWDWYWYNGDKIGIEQYIPNMNNIRGLQIYNTVGNHDNDMQHDSLSEFQRTGADWTCMTQYRKQQGPTCFSYNIGGVHYVSLDNVITTNTGGTTDKDSRGCWRGVTESDMRWLEQDLSYVSEDTPVVVSVHMPLFNMKGKPTAGNSKSINYTVQDITAPFRKFGKVLFISAHTHLLYNTEDYDVSGLKVTEWNSGALCGNFWTTALKTGLNLCTDGTPGGYRILTVDNGKISSLYKGIGKKKNYLFRAYDRNQMNLEASKLGSYTKGEIAGVNKDNWIYINVWDYKPSWKISVQEFATNSATTLQVTRMDECYDPLYMLMYGQGETDTTPQLTCTMFRAKANSATSIVTIRVEDEYGHSRMERIQRPKKFTVDVYADEQTE